MKNLWILFEDNLDSTKPYMRHVMGIYSSLELATKIRDDFNKDCPRDRLYYIAEFELNRTLKTHEHYMEEV